MSMPVSLTTQSSLRFKLFKVEALLTKLGLEVGLS